MALFNKQKRNQRMAEHRQSIYKNWGPISAKGKYYYALKQATVGWAWPILIIYVLMMYLLSKLNDVFTLEFSSIAMAGIVFMAFGFFQGSAEFNRNEKIYREKYPYGNKPKSKKKKKK